MKEMYNQIQQDPNNIELLAKAQEVIEAYISEQDPEGAQELTQVIIHTARIQSGKPLEF